MRDLSLHILKLLHKETFCEEWIQTKYKQKPIFIQGSPGCGKSSLAKYILRSRTIVYIHSDITKETNNLKQYLRDHLYKKNVTMLFSRSLKDKLPKALLFDDIDTIRDLNKSFFQECIQFSKKKNTDHPVIYVSSLLQGKDLQTLYNHSFPLSIELTNQQIQTITKRYFSETSQPKFFVPTVVKQCHQNLHSIQMTMDFYKTKDTIQSFDYHEQDPLQFLNQLLQEEKLSSLFQLCSCDYTILSLNILENILFYLWMKNTGGSHHNLISDIYQSVCLSDWIQIKTQMFYDWNFSEFQILQGIIRPLKKLRSCFPNTQFTQFTYTKQISRGIIYTHNKQCLQNMNLNYSHFYRLYKMLVGNTSIQEVKTFVGKHKITLKLAQKFLKHFEMFYGKKIQKRVLKSLF